MTAPSIRDQNAASQSGMDRAVIYLVNKHYASLAMLTYVCLGLVFYTPAEDLTASWHGRNWWMPLLVVVVILVSASLTFLMASRGAPLWRWVARGVTSILPVLALAYLLFLR